MDTANEALTLKGCGIVLHHREVVGTLKKEWNAVVYIEKGQVNASRSTSTGSSIVSTNDLVAERRKDLEVVSDLASYYRSALLSPYKGEAFACFHKKCE